MAAIASWSVVFPTAKSMTAGSLPLFGYEQTKLVLPVFPPFLEYARRSDPSKRLSPAKTARSSNDLERVLLATLKRWEHSGRLAANVGKALAIVGHGPVRWMHRVPK